MVWKTHLCALEHLERSSERFAALVGSCASRQEAVAAVPKFSFAPQRFSSRERPLLRSVVFCKQHHGSVCSRGRGANVKAQVRMNSGAVEADARRMIGDGRHARRTRNCVFSLLVLYRLLVRSFCRTRSTPGRFIRIHGSGLLVS